MPERGDPWMVTLPPADSKHRLIVRSGEHSLPLSVPPGFSLRQALDLTALRVRAACGGQGTCGACAVRVLHGDFNPLTLAEYQKLDPEQRAQGLRLACQLYPFSGGEIQIDHPALPSDWRSMPPEALADHGLRLPELSQQIFGVAVDLGTTHIRLSLWDRQRGQRIASRHGFNPQGVWGADILTRLQTATQNPVQAQDLARLARNAIIEALRDMLARDLGEVSPMLAAIGQVLIVGNTAMLALLSGRGVGELLNPERWAAPITITPEQPEAWHAQWPMPHARIDLAPPLAGFVGSDLLADLLATRFLEGPPGSLLVDFGTNSEIALWNGQQLWITSVPGGPAFETIGIAHGMGAEPGAIWQVRNALHGPSYQVLGSGPAQGFCGSGLVDAIAVLRQAGIITSSGRFAPGIGRSGYRLDPANPRTAILPQDIDAFQRAKAATGAAMMQLLNLAGLRLPEVQRLCICGAFGQHLDFKHAQELGLLPPGHFTHELFGDATLAGCERALLSPNLDEPFATLAARAQTINLSQRPDYENLFIDQLRLKPIG